MAELPYHSYSAYLRGRFGREVRRVTVDAGFGCPHRSGGRGTGGCTFCDEAGSRAPSAAHPGDFPLLRGQVAAAVKAVRSRHPSAGLILYFQAFSCTNAPASQLARIYEEGLSAGDFLGLSVAARPDCMDGEKARVLSALAGRGWDVWIELGLQSSHDSTLERIHRGHTAADFLRAHAALRSANVKVAVHVILGLPGESAADMATTAQFIAGIDPDGVKIHNLHIPRGSPLYREYLAGEVTAPGPERHLEYVISVLERLPPRTAILRLTTDTLSAALAAPRSFWPKQRFASEVAAEMRRRGTWQGRLWPPPPDEIADRRVFDARPLPEPRQP